MKLDTGARTVKLSDKHEIGFGQALVATGANVRRLNVPGCDLEGIHYLRTLGNSDTIRADAAGKRVVLIGGSYIGSEVAASLTVLGSECSIVMIEPVVLSRTFGETAGRFFQGSTRGARDRRSRRRGARALRGHRRPRHPRGDRNPAASSPPTRS